MLKLTEDEIALMRELIETGERQISNNKPRQGLDRIVKAGYVTAESLNPSVTTHTITDAGRAAFHAATMTGIS
jgi:hypothetical protein